VSWFCKKCDPSIPQDRQEKTTEGRGGLTSVAIQGGRQKY